MVAARVSTVMTSKSALFASCRAAASVATPRVIRCYSSSPLIRARASSSIPRAPVIRGIQQTRYHSNAAAAGAENKVYDFDAVKSLSETPDAGRVLIDVREPAEYTAGHLPTAINIPISSAPDALFMPADEFEDKFDFPKPSADQELVFYCKAGVRSSAAAQLARQIGYKKIAEYRGSWLDWQKNGGKIER